MSTNKKISRLKKLRIASQIIFIAFFFFLLIRTEYHGRDIIAYPVKVFLELDPLILITTFLASHTAAKMLLLGFITIALTLILGRVFCGWFCPLGIMNDFVGSFKKRKVPKETRLDRAGIKVKYYVLIAILLAAVFQMHLVGILDPISLTIRSFSVAVSPALNYAFHSMFDFLYRTDFAGISGVSEPVFEFLKMHILSFQTPAFEQGSLIGIIFLLILGLNFVRKRFWCRFICPLGALLALLSKFSLLNHRLDSEKCDDCMLCMATCAGGARPEPGSDWRGSECVLCMNCEDTCAEHAIAFKFGKPRTDLHRTDLKRRYIIGAGASGLASLVLLRLNPVRKSGSASLVRPPGSVEEEEFLRRCIKCGECMKVCITNGLQPTFLQAGLEGIWSPAFAFRIGYCEYGCTLCGQVCPTGSIQELDLETKKKVKIGLAFIDVGRCLPYAFKINCIVCEEHCPTDPKAIVFEKKIVATSEGELELKLPVVDPKLCIGCGICEFKCPVGEHAAIRISSAGEDRSDSNKIVL
jgi:polyferredoxin